MARVVLAVALLVPGAVIGAPSALAQDASGNSAVTLSGTGEFANLKVTVGQTKNLINQTVRVTWAGGTPTGATFNGNFLQIMQCWGDDAAGPDPMQCEFGAFAPGTSLSPIVSSRRQIAPVDPRLSIDSQNPNDVYLPFWPVGSAKPTQYASSNDNSYFDSQLSNEEESARTRPDGTGEIDFEMQTVRESGGLGCGAPVGDATRACWLVVVPQGATLRPTLSLDTWKQRIQFPLSFLRVGQPCPIGAPERLLAGHEVAVDAVTSWQPALCANGGALYSYTQLTDNLARSQLGQSSDPGLAILTNPVPPDQQPADRPLVYAPVVASGLAVAFNIVSNPNSPSYPAAGLPFASMKLTPRLVAKLLTQSYRNSLAGLGGALSEDDAKLISVPAHSARLQSNPVSLTADPEFLKLNPDFGLGFAAPVDVLVQLNPSDLTGQLWNWVLSDPDARAFVNGTADPSGMVVNDLEKNLTLPLDTFPRNDDSCIIQRIGTAIVKPFCASDAHLYAGDTHAAARSASRGDPLALDNINANADQIPFAYPKKQRQPVDARSLIAITDTATAARYQLSTATLLNSAGKFVAPDSAGLQAGLDAMKPDVTVSSVLQPDLASKNPAAYPLTTVSYAAASPATMVGPDGKKEATDLAAFLRYAAGPGQTPGQLPGQLPVGYLPLPQSLRTQALAAATNIETNAGKPVGGTPTPIPAPTPTPAVTNNTPASTGGDSTTGGSTNSGAATGGLTTGASPNPAAVAGADPISGTSAGSAATNNSTGRGSTSGATSPAPTGAASSPAASGGSAAAPVGAPTTVGATKAVATTQATPPLPAPAVGALLVALLIGGGLAAVLAPVTHLLSNQPVTPGGDAADRTTARSPLAWLAARSTVFASRR